MAQVVRETVITPTTKQSTVSVSGKDPSQFHTVAYLVYFFFGLLEFLLGFRLVFKLFGANPVSGFVRFIYSLTQPFVLPFEGNFRKGYTQGVETTSVLEPSTLVAMLVYGLLAWGIVKFVAILVGRAHEV
jgi:hypothetical protein